MTVLLTGFSGMLGRPTARALARSGHDVRVVLHAKAIDRRDLESGLDVRWADLGDLESFTDLCRGVSAVVHAAWEFRRDPEDRYRTRNRDGAVALLEAAAAAGATKFVNVSSVSVYGLDVLGVVDESAPLLGGPDDVYAATKIEVEQLLRTSADRVGIELVTVRPGLLYDEQRPPVKKMLGARLALIAGSGTNHLPFVHADDVADLLVRALADAPHGRVYNAVPSETVSARAFAARWRDRHSGEFRVIPLPVPVFKTLALAPWLVKQALGKRSTRPNVDYQTRTGTRDVRYRAERARRDLGWSDRHTATLLDGAPSRL